MDLLWQADTDGVAFSNAEQYIQGSQQSSHLSSHARLVVSSPCPRYSVVFRQGIRYLEDEGSTTIFARRLLAVLVLLKMKLKELNEVEMHLAIGTRRQRDAGHRI
jgi:hypothetical protein